MEIVGSGMATRWQRSTVRLTQVARVPWLQLRGQAACSPGRPRSPAPSRQPGAAHHYMGGCWHALMPAQDPDGVEVSPLSRCAC